MAKSKSIRQFLVDGKLDGQINVNLSNWSGKICKIPRTKVEAGIIDEELNATGVYILLSGANNIRKLYIGEAEQLSKRLKSHLKKDFWAEAICVYSKDDSLNKAHVKYLESSLYDLAIQSNWGEVFNSNQPTKSSLSAPEKAEMEEFLSNFVFTVKAIGYNLFEPQSKVLAIENSKVSAPISKLTETDFVNSNDSHLLCIKDDSGAYSLGHYRKGPMIVYRGSVFAKEASNKLQDYELIFRDEMINNGILKEINSELLLTTNYIFSSPSASAIIITGKNVSGTSRWKNKDGVSLGKLKKIEGWD